MVAVDVFGHFVRQEEHLDALAKLPTLVVQTEIDDSADHAVGVRVVKEIEDRTGILILLPDFLIEHELVSQEVSFALVVMCTVHSNVFITTFSNLYF